MKLFRDYIKWSLEFLFKIVSPDQTFYILARSPFVCRMFLREGGNKKKVKWLELSSFFFMKISEIILYFQNYLRV